MFINIKTKTLKQSYAGRWNNKIHLCPIKEKKSICAKLFDLKIVKNDVYINKQ